VIGFGDVHTRAHLYRAILEGLAYALREGGERCARRSGVPLTEIRVAGGGSQSDAAMQITEVVRGADLLKSTARQLLLIRALDLPTPAYYHCDLLRDQSGTRLAKRHDALSLRTLREQGHTPEQVLAMCSRT